MSACGEWAWLSPKGDLSRFYCGSGNCHRDKCRTLFWSRRIRLISALVEEYGLIRFFTLTLDPEFIQGDPWVYIHHPWSKMRKRLKRVKKGIRFVAVLERHKNRDVPHIHGFTDLWLSQAEWSRHWHESCGGRVVWIEKVKDKSASEYVSKQLEVAKYVGKDQIRATYKVKNEYGKEKRVRTLWRSEKTKARFELTTEEGWVIIKECVYNEDGNLTPHGQCVERSIYGKEEQGRQDVETACGTLPS